MRSQSSHQIPWHIQNDPSERTLYAKSQAQNRWVSRSRFLFDTYHPIGDFSLQDVIGVGRAQNAQGTTNTGGYEIHIKMTTKKTSVKELFSSTLQREDTRSILWMMSYMSTKMAISVIYVICYMVL